MASTYLQLTNKLLRRLNEVELNSDTFDTCRGVHAMCKDAISDAVSQINAKTFEWPFNAYEHTQTLIPGTSEYGWPDNFKVVDWNSFQLQKDDTLNINNRHLPKINRDEWYRKYKDLDDDAGSDGRGKPQLIFPAHGNGFGVTPKPDEAYDIVYRYYITPTQLSAHDDTTTIPTEYEWVIIYGALAISNLFKEDMQGSAYTQDQFEKHIDSMRTLLVNRQQDLTDTRVNNHPRPYRSIGYLTE